MILVLFEIYDLFKKVFGCDFFDGKGVMMDLIFNCGWGCVNVFWNGIYILFCLGIIMDDIMVYEWVYVYIEYIDGLIYVWQLGVLNEVYFDIWGEIVDCINNCGIDMLDVVCLFGVCIVFMLVVLQVKVIVLVLLVGIKDVGIVVWGLSVFMLSGIVVGVGVGINNVVCVVLLVGLLIGKIVFIDCGICGFSVKVLNVQNVGVIGVIIGNNQGGMVVINMLVMVGFVFMILLLLVLQNDGIVIKVVLVVDIVNVMFQWGGMGMDNLVCWLFGEDLFVFGGVICDMYNLVCYNNLGKVLDKQYFCGLNIFVGDNGGVYINFGVVNYGYVLLVDGGSYNGQNVIGIGLIKVVYIYYCVQIVYQGLLMDFVGYVDVLEQFCCDLWGVNLNDFKIGLLLGEVINDNDCVQVFVMVLVVELCLVLVQCNFQLVFVKNLLVLCDVGIVLLLFVDNFDGGCCGGVCWQVSYVGSNLEFVLCDWSVVVNLLGGCVGYVIFVLDYDIGICVVGGDQMGV